MRYQRMRERTRALAFFSRTRDSRIPGRDCRKLTTRNALRRHLRNVMRRVSMARYFLHVIRFTCQIEIIMSSVRKTGIRARRNARSSKILIFALSLPLSLSLSRARENLCAFQSHGRCRAASDFRGLVAIARAKRDSWRGCLRVSPIAFVTLQERG